MNQKHSCKKCGGIGYLSPRNNGEFYTAEICIECRDAYKAFEAGTVAFLRVRSGDPKQLWAVRIEAGPFPSRSGNSKMYLARFPGSRNLEIYKERTLLTPEQAYSMKELSPDVFSLHGEELINQELGPYEQEISSFCDRLKVKLLDKYRKGKEEHGQAPTNLDCWKEINQEVLDILNYHCIHNVNNVK